MAIPLPAAPGMSMLQGIDAGSTMMSRILQNRMQQQNLDQTQQRHVDNLAIRQAQDARAQEMHPLSMGLLRNQLDMHPLNRQKMQNEIDLFPIDAAGKQALSRLNTARANNMNLVNDPERLQAFLTQLGMVPGQDPNQFLSENPFALALVEKALGVPVHNLRQTADQRNLGQGFGGMAINQDPTSVESVGQSLYPEYYQNEGYGQTQLPTYWNQNEGYEQGQLPVNDAPTQFGGLSEEERNRVEKTSRYLQDSISMKTMGGKERADARKDMVGQLSEINSAKEINQKIGKAKNIIEEWPELYRSFSGVIFDPDRRVGADGYFVSVADRLAKMGLSKEEYAAAIQIDKIFMDILNSSIKSATDSGGGTRMTNMMREFMARAKAQFKNPDEANLFVLNELENANNRTIDREDAVRYGYKHHLYLPRVYDYESFNLDQPVPVNPVMQTQRTIDNLMQNDPEGKTLVKNNFGETRIVPNKYLKELFNKPEGNPLEWGKSLVQGLEIVGSVD